jgi:hypothetical protein
MWNSKIVMNTLLSMLVVSPHAWAQTSFFTAPVQTVRVDGANSNSQVTEDSLAKCADIRINPLGKYEQMRETLVFDGNKIPLKPGFQTQVSDGTDISVVQMAQGVMVNICPPRSRVSDLNARLQGLQYDSGARFAADRRRMYREERLIHITVYPAETSWTLNTDSLPMN